MTLAALPLASEAIAADSSPSSSGTGTMAPFAGFGTQTEIEFRGELFWATETQMRFSARESDGEQMLGVTDKGPEEKVWYECDFIDILHGASILSLAMGSVGTATVLAQELVSNGEVTHLARVLVSGVSLGETAQLRFNATCSDGSFRKRSLKIRGRDL